MATLKRKNPNAFKDILVRAQALDGLEAKVGWFGTAVYENGTPVGRIAAVQEFGASIAHPGGTPYRIDSDGKAVFVALDSPGANALPKTKPHQIVIPPRPFMRPTIAAETKKWLGLLKTGAKRVVDGKMDAKTLMEMVAAKAASDVAKTITELTSPPLKRSTIQARLRKKADKKTMGLLDKPLVDSGLMLDTLQWEVGKQS